MTTRDTVTDGSTAIPAQPEPRKAELMRESSSEGGSAPGRSTAGAARAQEGRWGAVAPDRAGQAPDRAGTAFGAGGARGAGGTGPGAGPAAAADDGGLVLSAVAGAGPVGRSGERATVRLREGEPEEPPRYAPEWLQLREPADAAARAQELLDPLRARLANLPGRTGGLAVHDLGCGTGSMGRWLAPRLDGAQHWVLHDRDPYLLHFAAVASPRSAADGSRVTVETRRGDVARLTPDVLSGASLVTASALLDVLTREEIGALVDACTGAGCPVLLTLSVAGRVELTPAHPLDAEIAEAFNAHQQRDGLPGPDAVTVTCEAFAARGATVRVHQSPWRLGPEQAALTEQWLRGWVGAAVEQRPALGERAERYLRDRLDACAAGELRVVVHHTDLLALPRPVDGTS